MRIKVTASIVQVQSDGGVRNAFHGDIVTTSNADHLIRLGLAEPMEDPAAPAADKTEEEPGKQSSSARNRPAK